MSGTRGDIEKFFRTLLLGDFETEQSTSAQIVGGLISMIPVLDQVMDARDITGTLYQINAGGGFKNANSEQLVNLGFAAFGAIPEVGSAFKTVFKPIWKERRAAKGAVHGGLSAVERMLHMKHGSAIRWIREELLGKWTARTNAAIAQVEAAMAAMIELTEFIANAQGWRDWLIPDSIQQLAREILPSLKQLQGQIRSPLERGSNEIHAFLEDLLGEQAAAVMMGVGQRAAIGSSMTGIRSKTGHTRADVKPHGQEYPREGRHKVASSDRTEAAKGKGSSHSAVRKTLETLKDLSSNQRAVIGEHMADYHELKRLGGSWNHDNQQGNWAPQDVKKINADHRPVILHPQLDIRRMSQNGMDAVWEHHGQYTITEAKARKNEYAARARGRSNEAEGKLPKVTELDNDRMLLHYLLGLTGGRSGRTVTQMSRSWIAQTLDAENLHEKAGLVIRSKKYVRNVVFVSLESMGAVDHTGAFIEIALDKEPDSVRPHTHHGITKSWNGADIDAVEEARNKELRKPNLPNSSDTAPRPGHSRSRPNTARAGSTRN